MSSSLRILFMGTPDFAVPSLEALVESRHDVVAVVTQPDRPAGRGKSVRLPPIKECAIAHGIRCYQPSKIRGNEGAFETLSALEPDIAVVAAYGQILPQRFLDIPTHGCINVHASLLPLYRGASPINQAIVDGQTKSGVTLMLMEAGLDTGPMLSRVETPIGPDETAGELHDRLAKLGASKLVETLEAWVQGTVEAIPQDDSKSSYAGMLKKSDGRLDFTRSAVDLSNQVRGFHPWPGTFAFLDRDGERLRVQLHKVSPLERSGSPGEILESSGDSLVVACGNGALAIERIQPAGKKAMTAREFTNGFQLNQADSFT